MNDSNSRADEFDRLTYITSSSRFYASERLKLQSRLGLYAAATLSLAATMQALTHAPWSNYVAAACSAFALAFSLIESSADRGVKAERLHSNAVAIRKLMYKCKHQPSSVEDLQNEYDELIRLCPENHAIKDYELAKAETKPWVYWFWSYSLYWVLITMAVIIIISGVFYV